MIHLLKDRPLDIWAVSADFVDVLFVLGLGNKLLTMPVWRYRMRMFPDRREEIIKFLGGPNND